jgi:hypothetical protein
MRFRSDLISWLSCVLVAKICFAANYSSQESGKNNQTLEERFAIETDRMEGRSDVRSLMGRGGPDALGYSWKDSREPDGPVYSWEDISTTGIRVTGLADDNKVGPFPIGFLFPYYGQQLQQFYIQSNGVISFTGQMFSHMNRYIPSADDYNNAIFWFWDDLHPRNSQVYYQSFGDRLIVQFNDYGQFYTDGTFDVQVILYYDSRIRIQYKDISSGFYTASSTIGIESATGLFGLNVAYQTYYISSGLAVEFSSSNISQYLVISEPAQNSVTWETGETVAIQWESSQDIGLYVKLELYKNGSYERTIDASTPDDQYKQWTVPDDLNPASSYQVRISSIANPSIKHTSPLFTITKAHSSLLKNTNTAITGASQSSMGCAWGDYDGDGFDDLFVANDNFEANSLYHNNGDGSFTAVSSGPVYTDAASSFGGSWADYDNDGDLDLYVVNLSNQRNALYRNEGNGSFAKITEGEIVTDENNSQGCVWIDVNNDGFVDLFVANFDNQDNCLYMNNGDGTFTKESEDIVANDGGDSVSASVSDMDNDGDMDLAVLNKNGKDNFLYINQGGSFKKVLKGEFISDGGNTWSGSWADYDNDGDTDLFVTNNDEENYFYSNDGQGQLYRNRATALTVGIENSRGSCWGDYNRDGFPDLFVTSRYERQYLHINTQTGYFWPYSSELLSVTQNYNSRGCTFHDVDCDGDLDIYICNDGQPNLLYMNQLDNGFHWIDIRLEGRRSNRSGIGARVIVKVGNLKQVREIVSQTGLGSQTGLSAYFGLGVASMIDSVQIQWPSGFVWDSTAVQADQYMVVYEPTLNHPPVAVNDTVSVPQDSLIEINVLANDTDADHDSLFIAGFDKVGLRGLIVHSPGKPVVLFMPEQGFSGWTFFRYLVDDIHPESIPDTGLVAIHVLPVNHPPVAMNDSLTILQDSVVTIHVIANDTDPDGDGLTITGVGDVHDYGQLFIQSGDTTLVFIPKGGFTGEVTFDYMISDSEGLPDTAVVYIRIEPATGVSDQTDFLPASYSLHQNHPNPFNPVTRIRYDLPQACDVRIIIYDVAGRQVAELVHKTQSAGRYQAVWEGRDNSGQPVPSGIYFYRIEAGEFVEVKKMLLVR